jgi:hypothetical protein
MSSLPSHGGCEDRHYGVEEPQQRCRTLSKSGKLTATGSAMMAWMLAFDAPAGILTVLLEMDTDFSLLEVLTAYFRIGEPQGF